MDRTMLSHWISVVFQFALNASSPQWTCELAHRDPGVPATMFLYCEQTAPDGIEIVSVGKYVPDAASTVIHIGH
jgi:hypothetical protein